MIAYNFMKYTNFTKKIFFLAILFLYSCQSEYTKLVKKELASNKKNDSIFYNLRFGNTKQEFFEICWDLNKQGLATHGGNNQNVKIILLPKDSTKTTQKVEMLFYPKFSPQNTITAMNVKFSYVAWAPWNKDLKSDKLFPAIQDTLLKWYPGNPFLKTKKGVIVKVDGNRQIQINKETDKDVSVLIEDLAYKYKTLVN